jgi:endonuclease/exonuclease/phosphatase family metal-dependent hydrolase
MTTCVRRRKAGLSFHSPLVLAALALLGLGAHANAQTTITINQPDSQVLNATLRGGSYANKNLRTILETRASDDPEYRRRALLKFDTQNTIAKGASVTSAILTVTVKQGSDDSTRNISVYQVTNSWEEPEVTWNKRKTGSSWQSSGGDLGSKLDEGNVSNAPGTKVTFDVTSLVKAAVAGQLGSSRYTRLVLLDNGNSTNESWRAYYTSEDSDTSRRPTLKVTYGGTAAPAPAPTSGATLRVVHWNIGKNGWGTDGKYSPTRVADWLVRLKPDVISINEAEKWNSYSLGEDGVALYEGLLESKTGVKWYSWDIQDYGNWDEKGLRNVIFSKYPFLTTYRTIYSAGKLKAVGGATINFNGRNINFMTTHFDPYTASYRATQARDLVAYAKGFAEDRIICGDFNDQATNPPITTMTSGYYDAWVEGKKLGIATSAPDNPYGNTRNSRIDYIFYSRGERHLTLKKVQVVDTRDSYGEMPSDHRPVLAEFTVQ